MVDKKTVQAGYDDIAPTYARTRLARDAEREQLERFLDQLPSEPTVLDAGCGNGDPVLSWLTSHCGAAVGLDLSWGQLNLARENAPAASHLQGDLTSLPFENGSFDGIVAFHSIIHVPKTAHQTVIDEFARVLVPGGRLFLTEAPGEWTGANPDWLEADVEMQWHLAGAETTRSQLTAAGFTIEREFEDRSTLEGEEDATWIYFEAAQS